MSAFFFNDMTYISWDIKKYDTYMIYFSKLYLKLI